MDVLSSLLSRRETYDAISENAQPLAMTGVRHTSLENTSEDSALIMYNTFNLFFFLLIIIGVGLRSKQ